MRNVKCTLLPMLMALSACVGDKPSPEAAVPDPGTPGIGFEEMRGPAGPADVLKSIDHILFDYDRSTVAPKARLVLERQAAVMDRYPQSSFIIEGHADERGTREYNLALGDRRAKAARDVLVAFGISPGRLTTVSYGKERPVIVGEIEAAWAQNRRAVTVAAQ
jgi:peptidoglycan-associated lipoprotein